MTVTAILVVELVGLFVVAAVSSWWLDRSMAGRVRPVGALRRRLPLIVGNVAALVVVTALATPWIEPWLTRGWANPVVLLGEALALLIIDDAWFYALHRAMHAHPALYRLHRLHHRATAPVPVEAFYAHPGEVGLVFVGPALGLAAVGLVVGEVHAAAFVGAMTWKLLHELDLHSGVDGALGRLAPVLAPAAHHDLHHQRPAAGNFGSTTLVWDTLGGTRVRAPARPS